MPRLVLLAFIIFVPMLAEARRSRRNELYLRMQGAITPPGDVYRVMRIAYPACFLAMLAEGWSRPAAAPLWAALGGAVFASGKGLKYWAIAALGPRWSFRVLVVPGSPLVATGPYRWLRHPNYIGVAGELAGVACLANAPIAGPLSLVLFGALMLARIQVEERALGRA